jgi:hypothetical protein
VRTLVAGRVTKFAFQLFVLLKIKTPNATRFGALDLQAMPLCVPAHTPANCLSRYALREGDSHGWNHRGHD